MRLFALSWLIATCALAQTAAAAGPSRGELLYQTCTACHTILGDGVGPDLTGI
jgi:cytochrome c2